MAGVPRIYTTCRIEYGFGFGSSNYIGGEWGSDVIWFAVWCYLLVSTFFGYLVEVDMYIYGDKLINCTRS